MIRPNLHLVEGLAPAGCRVLLPRLLASTDALVQAIIVHYMVHCPVLGRCRCYKKETVKGAAEGRAADQHDKIC